MGYQVGRICYYTKQQADDVVMSAVMPSIVPDGTGSATLYHPVKTGDSWSFMGQVVQLTHPECDPQEYFNAGIQISGILILTLVIIFGFRILKRFIYQMGVDNERE